MIEYYGGIDPGLSGAVAVLSLENPQKVELYAMPTIGKELDLFKLNNILSQYTNVFFTLEQVSAMPKQGVSSMFKFGKAYGAVQGILAANKIRFDLATPQRWQKKMHDNISKTSYPSAKDRSFIAARKFFPETNFHKVSEKTGKVLNSYNDGFIDAALIARYCSLIHLQ